MTSAARGLWAKRLTLSLVATLLSLALASLLLEPLLEVLQLLRRPEAPFLENVGNLVAVGVGTLRFTQR